MSLVLRYADVTSGEVKVGEDYIPVQDQTGQEPSSQFLLAALDALGFSSISDYRRQGYERLMVHILQSRKRAHMRESFTSIPVIFTPCRCHNLNLVLRDLEQEITFFRNCDKNLHYMQKRPYLELQRADRKRVQIHPL
jgi:hypothetical protein